MPAAYLALVTALVIAIVWDWRAAIVALAIQTFLTGILYLDVLEPRFVIIKLFVGWFVCIMLYVTGRQLHWRASAEDAQAGIGDWWLSRLSRSFRGARLPGADLSLRVFLALLVALAAVMLSQRQGLSLPAVTGPTNLAVLALGGLGLVGLATKSNPLLAGAGLLTFMNGFELFYSSLEQSVATLIFLAAANLVLALTISYLAQSKNITAALVGEGERS